MGINKLLISNVNSVQNSRNLCGDALEALIGSIFIDKGFSKTKKLFIKKIFCKYLNLDNIIKTDTDYKSLVSNGFRKIKPN